MRSWCLALLTAASLGATAPGAAQDFGVMESAEIIQRGNIKITGYPVFVLGGDGVEGDVGGVLRGGYGFSDRVDGELGVALYDGAVLFGGNLEAALLRARQRARGVDLSVRAGVYLLRGDAPDATGLDLAALLSTHLTPDLELVGSLDFDRRFYDAPLQDVNTLHLVPGVEYRVSRYLDLLAEFGLALDDDATNYLAAGLAVYLR